MTTLTQGMYQLFGGDDKPYGLHYGQLRGDEVVHNGRWYNKKGQMIGLGDLSKEDLERLHLQLPEGELFVILSENDSSWTASVRDEAPGIAYVAAHAMYIVGAGLYLLVDHGKRPSRYANIYGLTFEVISEEITKRLCAS